MRNCLIVVMSLAVYLPLQAQDPLSRKDLDSRLDAALFDVAKQGTELFNLGNDPDACARLYEGALRIALPMLDHHKDVQVRAAALLRQAGREPLPTRAFTMRKAIDDIRGTIAPPPKPPVTPTVVKSLWDRLGGEAAVRKVVKEFFAAAAANKKIDFDRGGKYPHDPKKLEQLLVEFVSSASGGPLKYTGRDMKTAHAGMKITADQFEELAAVLKATLVANKVGDKEIAELIKAVGSTANMIIEQGAPAPPPVAKSLWDRLGGETAVKAVVHEFMAVVSKNPKVNVTRGGTRPLDAKGVEALEKKLVEFISSVTGGPHKYTGKDMKTAHAGMKITEAEFDAAGADLAAAMKKLNVPQKESDELMNLLGGLKKDVVEMK